MKEIFFKGFGFIDEDGSNVFACIGLSLEYDVNSKLVNSFYKTKLYRNINNTEEASIVAGLDMLAEIEENFFFRGSNEISVCVTSNVLSQYYNKFFEKTKVEELVSINQSIKCDIFNNEITRLTKEKNISFSIVLGVENERVFKGVELLSKVEDILIEMLQERVDAKKDWKEKKRDLVDSELKQLGSERKVLQAEYDRVAKHNDMFTQGTSYDEENAKELVNVYHKNKDFFNAEENLNRIKNDIKYLVSRHQYY